MSEKSLPLSKRGLNFEMFMWLITRLTALGMYALLLTAVIGALIMGARTQMNIADVIRWSFMPNPSHVQSTNVPDLAPWGTAFWQSHMGHMDWLSSRTITSSHRAGATPSGF